MSSHPPLTNNHESSSSSSSPPSLRVGIVGFGSFAQFLAKTILKHCHCYFPFRLHSPLQPPRHLLLQGLIGREVDRFLEGGNDVIMICTSILSFQGVIDSMPFHLLRKPALFVDVLSVKEHPKHLLIKREFCEVTLRFCKFREVSTCLGYSARHCQKMQICYALIQCLAPRAGKMGGRVCHLCSRRFVSETNPYAPVSSTYLKGCRMLEMSCEEHDRLAARSQFLSHTIGRTLTEMEIESTPINTKSFQSLLQLKESTVEDSFDLFKGLFVYNRFAKEEVSREFASFLSFFVAQSGEGTW